MRDPEYNKPAANAYAHNLRVTFALPEQQNHENNNEAFFSEDPVLAGTKTIDSKTDIENKAIEAFKNSEYIHQIESATGVAWGTLNAFFSKILPCYLDNRREFAFQLVRKALNTVFPNNWDTYPNPDRNGKTYIRTKNQ